MRTARSLFSLTPHPLLMQTRRLLAARAENTAELLAHLAEIRVLLAERDGQPARRELLAQTVVNPQGNLIQIR